MWALYDAGLGQRLARRFALSAVATSLFLTSAQSLMDYPLRKGSSMSTTPSERICTSGVGSLDGSPSTGAVASSAGLQPATQPRPRRWLLPAVVRHHRFGSSLILLVAFVLMLRLGWDCHQSRQLNARLDDIRRAGQPATLSEVVIQPVPDGGNAWLLYAQAAAGLNRAANSPGNSTSEFPNYPPFGPAWDALAGASERRMEAYFNLPEMLAALPRAQLRQGPLSLKSTGAPTSISIAADSPIRSPTVRCTPTFAATTPRQSNGCSMPCT